MCVSTGSLTGFYMGKEELAFLTRVTKSPKGVEAHKDYTDQVQDAYPRANQGCSGEV